MERNAGSKPEIAAATKADAVRREQDEAALRMVMSTMEGRRFLGNLIFDPAKMLGGGCGVNQSVFSPDDRTMAALEGARDVSLRLLSCVKALNFEAFMQIQRERYASEATEAAIIEQAAEPPKTDFYPHATDIDG